ncbi:MAG: serine/threonine protein kinase [Candidatus Fervidibacter sp.]|uniref:serine/threonine protein kinase n=1 Tax=Candidatus Fervidibacter sp. TaxID=3100871 RepID=UPI004048F214
MIGQHIGRYQIIREIGKGRMGVVYQAFDPILSRYLAIKTLSPYLATDPEVIARFFNEARIAASLQHPNIVMKQGRTAICFIWRWSSWMGKIWQPFYASGDD